jgi:hypothetical protein
MIKYISRYGHLAWVEGLFLKIEVLELAETLCFTWREYANMGETLVFIEFWQRTLERLVMDWERLEAVQKCET